MAIHGVPFYMGDEIRDLELPTPYVLHRPALRDGVPQGRMAVINEMVARIVSGEQMPVVYCGDCVVILGVTAGLQRRGCEPVVVFYDAHGDFNTWETTPSGFIGGMPLAMLTGRGEQTIADGCSLRAVPDGDVVLVGARDLDPGERVLLDDSGVLTTSVDDVAGLVSGDRDLYVHIDVDVVDPAEMPAVNYPAPRGPSVDAVARSVAELAETGRVVAFSVSTWNPALPDASRAAAATAQIAAPFL